MSLESIRSSGVLAPKSGIGITVSRKQGSAALLARVKQVTRLAAYVGVPAAGTERRSEQLLGMAAKTSNKLRITCRTLPEVTAAAGGGT